MPSQSVTPSIFCHFSGIIRWWNGLSDALKAAVGIGALVLLISFIACCCCCCNRKSRPPGGRVIVTGAPAAVVGVASTNTSTVPMNNYARFP